MSLVTRVPFTSCSLAGLFHTARQAGHFVPGFGQTTASVAELLTQKTLLYGASTDSLHVQASPPPRALFQSPPASHAALPSPDSQPEETIPGSPFPLTFARTGTVDLTSPTALSQQPSREALPQQAAQTQLESQQSPSQEIAPSPPLVEESPAAVAESLEVSPSPPAVEASPTTAPKPVQGEAQPSDGAPQHAEPTQVAVEPKTVPLQPLPTAAAAALQNATQSVPQHIPPVQPSEGPSDPPKQGCSAFSASEGEGSWPYVPI